MKREDWPIDENHNLATVEWERYPFVIRFLNLVYAVHNKILACAIRRAPVVFNPKEIQ